MTDLCDRRVTGMLAPQWILLFSCIALGPQVGTMRPCVCLDGDCGDGAFAIGRIFSASTSGQQPGVPGKTVAL